jgi:hypothetical protein
VDPASEKEKQKENDSPDRDGNIEQERTSNLDNQITRRTQNSKRNSVAPLLMSFSKRSMLKRDG